jgi:formate-dependent phosphoribosylglycinamide formyltransferase (GAR transformylase)
VYSPAELSRVLEKQVEAQLGAYSITGLELEGVLGVFGEIGGTPGSAGLTDYIAQKAQELGLNLSTLGLPVSTGASSVET